jgi:hypothetical protein
MTDGVRSARASVVSAPRARWGEGLWGILVLFLLQILFRILVQALVLARVTQVCTTPLATLVYMLQARLGGTSPSPSAYTYCYEEATEDEDAESDPG